MKGYEITNIHEEIVKVLLGVLKENPKNAVISYSELCSRINDMADPRTVANYLGDISCWSRAIGAPMLSAMVVNKNNWTPGKGFFHLYTELYGKTVKKEEEDAVFIKELNRVISYKKWNELKYYLGI